MIIHKISERITPTVNMRMKEIPTVNPHLSVKAYAGGTKRNMMSNNKKQQKPKTKQIKEKKPRVIKPLKVWALEYDTLEGGPVGVLGLYRKEKDALIDQTFEHETTQVNEMILYPGPVWRERYKSQINYLKRQIAKTEETMKTKSVENHKYFDKRDIKRWNREIDALQSALNCNEIKQA